MFINREIPNKYGTASQKGIADGLTFAFPQK